MIALSDVLITGRPDDARAGKAIGPLLSKPYVGGRHVAVGASQKAVLLSPHHAVMWAGSQVVAKVVVASLVEAVRRDPETNIREHVASLGLTEAERQNSAYILLHRTPEISLCSSTEACEFRPVEGSNGGVVGAGTGLWDFYDDLKPNGRVFRDDAPAVHDNIPEFLSRISATLQREGSESGNIDYAYGSWFEVTHYDNLQQQFVKWPYSVGFWNLADDDLELAGALFMEQRGFNTVVHGFPGAALENKSTHIYGDFLDRTPFRDSDFETLGELAPTLQFHLVRVPAGNQTFHLVNVVWPHDRTFYLGASGIQVGDEIKQHLLRAWESSRAGPSAQRLSDWSL